MRVHAAPDIAGLVGCFGRNDFANASRMHNPHRLLIGRMRARLKIDEEHQLLFRRLSACIGHSRATGHIHRHRLGAIDVLARLNRRRCVLGMKIRRRFNDDGVELLFKQSFVTREPAKSLIGLHLELIAGFIHPVRKIIGQSHQIVISVFSKKIRNPLPASAAANQPDFYSRRGRVLRVQI